MQIDFMGYWDFTENQYEWHPSRVMRKDYSAWGHMRIVQDTRSISIVEGQTHKGKQGQTLEQELSDWWSDSCDLDASSKIITATIGHKSSGVRVGYEIIESYKKNNGLLGIYIHNLRDRLGYTDSKGANPFDNVYITSIDGSKTYFSSIYPTYDWVNGNGRQNIGAWIEGAAKRAGR